METKVQEQIIDYFSYFDEYYNTTKSSLKICQNCAISINKLIHRCRCIKEAQVTGTPLEEFRGLQNKLLSDLHNLISEEVQEVQSQRLALEESFKQLCSKNRALSESCKEIDISQETILVTGTPLQPPLEKILEFVTDTISFAGQICAQIESSLHILYHRACNTESLVKNFEIPTSWQRKIPEIIAYTSFCSENII